MPLTARVRTALAQVGLALVGAASIYIMQWSAPWRLPGAVHAGEPRAAFAAFARGLPIVQPFVASIATRAVESFRRRFVYFISDSPYKIYSAASE